MHGGQLFGSRYRFKQDLEVIDLGDSNAVALGDTIADRRFADAGRTAYEQHLPVPSRHSGFIAHRRSPATECAVSRAFLPQKTSAPRVKDMLGIIGKVAARIQVNFPCQNLRFFRQRHLPPHSGHRAAYAKCIVPGTGEISLRMSNVGGGWSFRSIAHPAGAQFPCGRRPGIGAGGSNGSVVRYPYESRTTRGLDRRR